MKQFHLPIQALVAVLVGASLVGGIVPANAQTQPTASDGDHGAAKPSIGPGTSTRSGEMDTRGTASMERLLDAATAHDRLLHCLDDPRLNQIRYATTVAMIHGERRISVKLTYLDGTDAPAEARTCMVHSLTRAEKRMWAGDATYRKALRESPLSATRTFTVFPVGLAYDWLTGSACAIRSECLRPAGLGTVCYEADVEPSQLRDRLFWRLRITNKKLPRETMWRFKVTTRACEADFSYAPSPRHHPVDVKKVERCMNQVLNTFAAKAARVRFYTPDWILLTSGLRRVPFCNFWNEHILPPDHE